ncbi:hypothetical protein HHK36_001950 [Tetracentron sinense]|uniref:Uncharacterized protein n=1 Tax=Tetracentron sinense TaxID=13715 RepID=A0A835DRJ7_TETSI|nr:hypothetical protein HHK36_001950 [Tetracentron sinense]
MLVATHPEQRIIPNPQGVTIQGKTCVLIFLSLLVMSLKVGYSWLSNITTLMELVMIRKPLESLFISKVMQLLERHAAAAEATRSFKTLISVFLFGSIGGGEEMKIEEQAMSLSPFAFTACELLDVMMSVASEVKSMLDDAKSKPENES